jgi:type IV pilus assembly protein PilB
MSNEIYAFLRSILQNPDDEVGRLVFADWLEETGDPDCLIWAEYIRTKWRAIHTQMGSPEEIDLQSTLTDLNHSLKFRLHFEANHQIVSQLPFLTWLIPSSQITLKLRNFLPFPEVIEFISESILRENCFLPLQLNRHGLWIVIPNPANQDTLKKLSFILHTDIHAVHGNWREILDTLDKLGMPEFEYA